MILTVPSTRRVAGEFQDLATVRHPLALPSVVTGAASVSLLYLIGLAAMHVPRLVTWREVAEILVLLDHSHRSG
jgi:hypothetical protein